MKKHFMRQTVCSVSNEEVTIAECYEEILGEKYPNVIKSNHLCNQMSSSDVIKCNPNVIKCYPNVINCNPDVIFNVISCQYCDRTFTKRQNKWRHEKTCKEKESYTKEEVAEAEAKAEAKAKAKAEAESETWCAAIMNEKDKIIDELRNQIEKMLPKLGNTNNTTNNNTYNTIVINAFGNENLDYIQGDFVKELVTRGPYSAIPKLLKEIHFNPEHRENNNIKILNRKEKYAKTYNGKKWEYADKNLTLENMTDRAFNVLIDYGSGKKFERFYDDYDDRDTGLLKRMKHETEMMILNNQNDVND